MLSDNSTQNIFRFMQLRAARVDDGTERLLLNGQTPLARQLADADPSEKKKIAKTFLSTSNPTEFVSSTLARRILEIMKELRDRNGSVEDLRNEVGRNSDEELRRIQENASDVLLASKFASWGPPQLPEVQRLFRALSIVLNRGIAGSAKLAKYQAHLMSSMITV
jgi:hypothetical protein